MEIFKSVDIDGNGRIEKNELQIAFSKTLGREATEVEVENMFKAVDMNDDGKISFDEYFTIMRLSLNADKEMQKLIDAFEVRLRCKPGFYGRHKSAFDPDSRFFGRFRQHANLLSSSI